MKQTRQEINKILTVSFLFIVIKTRFTCVDRANAIRISLRIVNSNYTIA